MHGFADGFQSRLYVIMADTNRFAALDQGDRDQVDATMQDAGAAGAKRSLSGDLEVSVPKLSKVELSAEVLDALNASLSTAVEKCFGSLSSKLDTKLESFRNEILKVTTDTVDAQVKAILQQTAAEAVKAALETQQQQHQQKQEQLLQRVVTIEGQLTGAVSTASEALAVAKGSQQQGQGSPPPPPRQQQQQQPVRQDRGYDSSYRLQRLKRLRFVGPFKGLPKQGTSLAEQGQVEAYGVLGGVLPQEQNFEIFDIEAFPAGKECPGHWVVVFSVQSAEVAKRLLRARKQLRAKGFTLQVDLTRQEAANRRSVLRDPRYQAAVEKVLASPPSSTNIIHSDLDCFTVVYEGRRTVWSVQHLAQLDRQAAAAAAAAAAQEAPAARQAPAAAAAASAAAGGAHSEQFPPPPPGPPAGQQQQQRA